MNDQGRTIYADYQATTPVDPRVLEKMSPFWRESFGNPHSSDHVVGWSAAEAVQASLSTVASLIGGDEDEVVFTSGATEANNLALLGLGRRAPADRRRILVSAIEHKCVLAAAGALAEREGFLVEFIPVDREGFVDLAALEDLVDERVLVASVMAVNNEIGTSKTFPASLPCFTGMGPCFTAMPPKPRARWTFAHSHSRQTSSASPGTRCTGRRASGLYISDGNSRLDRAGHIWRRTTGRPAVRHPPGGPVRRYGRGG